MWSWPAEQTLSTAWGGVRWGGGTLLSPTELPQVCWPLPLEPLTEEKSNPSFHKKVWTQPLPTEMWPLQPWQQPSLGWGECGTGGGGGGLEPGRPVAASPEQVREWAVRTWGPIPGQAPGGLLSAGVAGSAPSW